MVRRFRQRFSIRFRREQIEPAINLKSIRADDFGAARACDFCGELGFPDRSRTDDEEDALHHM